jgi:hypothetical protein
MIVVTAMPVVNAKARTITTKIVFMTLVPCSERVSVPEPARRFCDRHHGTAFRTFAAPGRGAGPAKWLYLL